MKSVRKLTRFIRPYWKLAVTSLVMLTTLVFLDLSIPRLIQRIIDQGITAQNQSVVLHTSLIMIGISILSALVAISNNIFSVRVGEGVSRDLRDALFLKIQTFSYGNLDSQKTGRLMVRLTSDVNAIKRLVQVSLRIGTRAPLLMIGSLILMINTSRTLALTLLPLLLLTSGVIVFFILKMEPLFRTVQQKLDRLNTVLQENIAGVRLVKAFVRDDYESRRFEISNEDYTERSIRVMKVMTIMSPVLTFLVNIGMVLVLWSGGLQSIRGDMTIGQIVAFTNYLLTTMNPLIMMTMLSNTWARGLVSVSRVNEILDTIPEIQISPDSISFPDDIEGRVTFENVAFIYNGDCSESVLRDISFTAEPGETVAILGATGAGKSTLINLVPRFYDVTSGRILIDGIDIRNLTEESLLSQIAVVPQDTILFSGTVRDNIRYGRPDASDDEVMAAAKAAQAHDFIMERPSGYDAHVEPRGTNFSGGQKQRISIARALLTRPKILILDDSTSAVDVETETEIQDALDNKSFQHTSLVVAQRISTVLRADKIIVIDKGKIAAMGTHKELLKSSRIYQEIYESQLGDGFILEPPTETGKGDEKV